MFDPPDLSFVCCFFGFETSKYLLNLFSESSNLFILDLHLGLKHLSLAVNQLSAERDKILSPQKHSLDMPKLSEIGKNSIHEVAIHGCMS